MPRLLSSKRLQRAGAASAIRTQVGTNPNDLATLRRTFGDVEDFNRAKSRTLFGDQPTQNMLNAVDREGRFAETAGPAIAGSRTTPMALASKAIDDAEAPSQFIFPKLANVPGLLAHAGEWGVRKVADAVGGAAGPAVREQLTQALLAPPEQRTAIVQGLLADQLMRSAARTGTYRPAQ